MCVLDIHAIISYLNKKILKNSVSHGQTPRNQSYSLILKPVPFSIFWMLPLGCISTPLLENSLRNESITGAESMPVVAKWGGGGGRMNWGCSQQMQTIFYGEWVKGPYYVAQGTVVLSCSKPNEEIIKIKCLYMYK